MDSVLGALGDLARFGLVVLAFLGPVEAFLRFRLRRATLRGDPRGYLALTDPWVTPIVALSGLATTALIRVLS